VMTRSVPTPMEVSSPIHDLPSSNPPIDEQFSDAKDDFLSDPSDPSILL
jgi:hypothetical protein